jgi:hypothetical protein
MKWLFTEPHCTRSAAKAGKAKLIRNMNRSERRRSFMKKF